MSLTTEREVKPVPSPEPHPGLDVERIRGDFPVLSRLVHGKPLAYLDNAATTQKPRLVAEAMAGFYLETCSNVHRGVHELSQQSTREYERARARVREFINARQTREIVFVRGTTEAINLVAATFGRAQVGEGDEILITTMEHHSNIVPWQILCQEKGAHLRVAPINDRGEVVMEDFERMLTERTRLVSVVHVSNALGTVNPVREMISMAHERGIPILVDGAQAAPHMRVDVQDLDCDFYAFSGHKLFGPTGIGVLYGKAALLQKMPPYQGGGDMILSVTFDKTVYNQIPYRFEAGTPHIAGAIGLGAAIDYLEGLGMDAIETYERDLLAYATQAVSVHPRVKIVGTAAEKSGALSFVVEGIHPHDVGTILDLEGVAIRTGHHCAQPVMERFGIPATARASFAFYNTREDVDRLVAGLGKVMEVFG